MNFIIKLRFTTLLATIFIATCLSSVTLAGFYPFAYVLSQGPQNAATIGSITNLAQTTLTVGWTDNSTDETGFKVQQSTDNATWTTITTTAANITSYNVVSLTTNTLYYFRVIATNTGGDAAASSSVSATTLTSAPTAPSGLIATNDGTNTASKINLTWTDTSTNETGFKIERSTNNITFAQIGTVTTNVTSYSDSTCSESTTYYYKVRAYNAGGDSAYTNVAFATTSAVAIATCTGPSNCYPSEGGASNAFTTAGEVKFGSELLYWSNHAAPKGKGESYYYGHWYKASAPNTHLVDNRTSTWVQTNKIYVDLTNVDGVNITGNRAANGLYYKPISGVLALDSEFGITTHGQLFNAEHCNWVNVHMNSTNVCATIGMRLPRIREALTSSIDSRFDSCNYTGGPAISGSDGVPPYLPYPFTTWAASAVTASNSLYAIWYGSTGDNYFYYGNSVPSCGVCPIAYVSCVLP